MWAVGTEYRQDPRKGARLFLVGLVLVALSVGLTIIGLVETGPDRVVFLAVGIAGVLLFSSATSILARRVIAASPMVTVTPRGLVLPDAGLLRWADIVEIRIEEVRGQRFLGVVPRDVEGYLRRLPAPKRAMARLNARMGFAPIALPENGLPVSLEALMTTIEQQRQGGIGPEVDGDRS